MITDQNYDPCAKINDKHAKELNLSEYASLLVEQYMIELYAEIKNNCEEIWKSAASVKL